MITQRAEEKTFDGSSLDERARLVYAQQDAEHRALTDRLFAVLATVLWTATAALYALTLRPSHVDFSPPCSRLSR